MIASTDRLGRGNLSGNCDTSVTYFPSPALRRRRPGVSSWLSFLVSGKVKQRRSSVGAGGTDGTFSASALKNKRFSSKGLNQKEKKGKM